MLSDNWLRVCLSGLDKALGGCPVGQTEERGWVCSWCKRTGWHSPGTYSNQLKREELGRFHCVSITPSCSLPTRPSTFYLRLRNQPGDEQLSDRHVGIITDIADNAYIMNLYWESLARSKSALLSNLAEDWCALTTASPKPGQQAQGLWDILDFLN